MKTSRKGFSLISLMVGVSLSMISILALLSLYKNLIGVSVQSIQDSRQDGQIVAALLTAQRELQSAGFRLDAAATPIMLLNDAELTNGILTGMPQALSTATQAAPATGNALVWSFRPNATGNPICVGLLMKKDPGKETGTLMHLHGAASCTQVSQWSTTSWTTSTLIESNQPASFFSAVYTPCWPFGKTADTMVSHLQVTMNADTSTLDISSTDPQRRYVRDVSSACLPNLPKAVAS